MRRAALLGACTGAALLPVGPPLGVYPLVFVAFVPLLRAADSRYGPGGAALAGWVAGAIFYAGVFDWAAPAIARLQGIDPGAAWCLFALFAALHAAQFALAGALIALLARNGGRRAVAAGGCGARGARGGDGAPPSIQNADLHALPNIGRASRAAAVWVLLEWSVPKVFPWSIGAALGPDPLLRQGADLGGVYGLSGLIMLVNGLLATASERRIGRRRRLAAAIAAAVLLALARGYGAWRMPPPTSARAGVHVAVAQGGIAPDGADAGAAAERALATYVALSRGTAAAADLLVWPESALPVYLRDNDVVVDRLGALLDDIRRPLLLGALDRRDHDGGELNAAYLLVPGATLPTATYHKVTLLPFGEFVPGAALWSRLQRWQTTGDFRPGERSAPIDVDARKLPLRLAPSICFEAIVPGAFNAHVRAGAELLVNLTDDGWFASEKAAAQHLELTRLRAVETRRWLVRASNSGISAFIDPAGHIAASLPVGAVGVLSHLIDPRSTATPYVVWGNWMLPLCAAVVALSFRGWSAQRLGCRHGIASRGRTAAPRLGPRRESSSARRR